MFKPTYRRILLFAILALAPFTGLLDFVPPIKVFLMFPYILVFDQVNAVIAQVVYVYILTSFYASGYLWLEKNLRQYTTLKRADQRLERKARPARAKKARKKK
jgi:hypothetical protein